MLFWYWLIIAAVLLASELITGTTLGLWLGGAAIITAGVAWVVPITWHWQLMIFCILGFINLSLWWKWWRKQKTEQPRNTLNQGGYEWIGQEFMLAQPIQNGIGKLRIGDTDWRISASSDLPSGVRVRVVALDGATLRVEFAG